MDKYMLNMSLFDIIQPRRSPLYKHIHVYEYAALLTGILENRERFGRYLSDYLSKNIEN